MERQSVILSLASKNIPWEKSLSRVEWQERVCRSISDTRRELEKWLKDRDSGYVLLPAETGQSSSPVLQLTASGEVIGSLIEPTTRPVCVKGVESPFEVSVDV